AGTTTLIGMNTTSIAIPSAPPNPVLPRNPYANSNATMQVTISTGESENELNCNANMKHSIPGAGVLLPSSFLLVPCVVPCYASGLHHLEDPRMNAPDKTVA